MNRSLLHFFLKEHDRVLFKQYTVLLVRNVPILIAAHILLYLTCTLLFFSAMPWFWHIIFGISLIVMSALPLVSLSKIIQSMQRSPENCIRWVLGLGFPILLWWAVYFFVLIRTRNILLIQQYTLMISIYAFIAIATVGRFTRTVMFFILAFTVYTVPLTFFSKINGAEFLVMQILLSILSELFFLRTLNEQVDQLFLVTEENSELLLVLQQKNEALEQANLSQSRYLSAASHDLRQPLHALALLTNDAQRKNQASEIDSTLKKMELAIDSLSQSFNAMLNLSRLDAGVVKPQFKHFPIQRLLQRLAVEFTDIALEKNLAFHIRPSRFWVLSDEDMLYSIMSNFVSNALRYTQHGGVLIGTRYANHGIFKLVVYDTGSGVPSEKAQQIFQEYQRLAEAEQRVKGGVGLGLAISERMARLLGVKLWVKSSLGQGSAFGLHLMRAEPAAEAIDTLVTMPDILAHKRAAIFDDDEIALESLDELLTSWGLDVSIVLSSAMYDELVQEEGSFDFVISDYHLGLATETGLDILHHVRQTPHPPICLLLTGDTRTELAQEAHEVEVYLWYKPIRPARLRAYLSDLAQAANQTQA